MATKKILGGLFEIETSEKVVPVVVTTPSNNSYYTPQVQPSIVGNDKFVKRFDDLFNTRNLPGPDYYEFSKMCDALSAIPEIERIKAAFAALSVQGLDKIQLVKTADNYINIFNEDKTKFNIAVTDGIKNVEGLGKMIQEKKDMIANLEREIAEHEKEINESTTKIQNNSSAYNNACDTMVNRIAHDIELIQKTL